MPLAFYDRSRFIATFIKIKCEFTGRRTMYCMPPAFYGRSRFIATFIKIKCEFTGRRIMLEIK